MENDSVVLNVDLNISDAQENLDGINQRIEGIGATVAVVGASIVKALTATVKNLSTIETDLNTVAGQLQLISQEMSSLVIAQSQIQSGGWLEGLSATSDVCTVLETLNALTEGQVVLQIKNAAAWISETSAKVANTAATWAQVAATTAWQAICTAATAVTTALGAAMQFLTSPIGLVVLAIGAVIAIVALLIANWDTVSAKAKEVWDFVKTKFEEFNLFLQGVFAKDWPRACTPPVAETSASAVCAAIGERGRCTVADESTEYRKRPRCSALPVADEAEHKRVPRSADDAGVRAKETAGHRKRGECTIRCAVGTTDCHNQFANWFRNDNKECYY